MDIAAAFRILELSNGATLEDVSASFRRLLKRYHPDRNLDRMEWSHEKTVRLTQAYEAVTDYIRTVAAEQPDIHAAGPRTATQTVDPEQTEPDDSTVGSYSITLQLRLAAEFDLLLDQLYAYYAFGLNNIHLRNEGTLRYRYRSAVRRMRKMVETLQAIRAWPGSQVQYQQIDVVHAFAAAFYENMLIKPREHVVPTGNERKAYQLYRQGSEALDAAIKARLVEDCNNGSVSPSTRSMSERSLMMVMAHFPKALYTPETLIKYYLLESFTNLCKVLDEG
jgi:hypothetical protein